MVPHKVSFVERLSLSQRVPYQRFHKIVDRKLSACDTLSNQTISLSLSLHSAYSSPLPYLLLHDSYPPPPTNTVPAHSQPTHQPTELQRTLISSVSPSSYSVGATPGM